MRRSPPPSILLPTNQSRTRNIRQTRRLTITQRHINMLAPPRPPPPNQRRHNTITRIQPRRQIRNRHTHLRRRAIPMSRDMHEPELGLDHDVVARAVGVRACLAVARDAGVDDGGVEGGDGGVVHAVFFEGAGEVVLDEDVAVFGEAVEDVYACWVGEGETYGLLVAVYLLN